MTSPNASRSRQLGLFDGPIRPVKPADPNVEPAAVPRLSRQARAVLLMLRSGPCSARALSTITHRFGGRLYDLRRAGCDIHTDYDAATGAATYTLRHEPEGLR